jgi:2-polyprenyl-6-methoxyphenol hydroxylase-like FAD-dependent oxidoreductase
VPGSAVPIGDAALTRDALASQGTAIALSDACQAADPRTADAELSARCADARGRHVRHLDEMLRTCRYAAEPTWEAYRCWLRDSVVR